MKKQYIAACLAGVTTLGLGAAANADVVFSDPMINVGPNAGQQLGQSGFDLAMGFTANCPLTVTALGTFDANLVVAGGNIATSLGSTFYSSDVPPVIQVAIYNVATGVAVTPIALFQESGAGGYYAVNGSIFQNLNTAVTLGPGKYAIVATGYTFLLESGNTASPINNAPPPTFNTLGGGLTLDLNGASFDGTQENNGFLPLELPTTVTGQTELGGNPDFLAGTFMGTCNCSGVPDGGTTVGLLGFALAGIAGLSRKLKR